MAIRLSNVSKSYGGQTALRNVDLEIAEGEFVTLLGPSGCGKTTLLRIIAGFVEPTTGRVLLDDDDITGVAPNRRGVGLVFQSYALFPHMTVAGNVAFGLRMRRVPKARAAEKVEEVLDLVDLSPLASRYPGQLSGGQQQRVALARVLAVEPRVLLLDEPLAALDRRLRVQMQTELTRLIDRIGITTIFVTHDQDEALTMSDRVAVMDHGEVVQYAPPTEVYDHPSTSFVASFVGTSNLLPGTVRREGRRMLFCMAGEQMPLPETLPDVPEGDATLLLRPEHLRLETANSGPGHGFKGVVASALGVGDSTHYVAELSGGTTLQVVARRRRRQAAIPVGTPVQVVADDPEACWLVPGDP